jgi:hypothetical protein
MRLLIENEIEDEDDDENEDDGGTIASLKFPFGPSDDYFL